MEFGPLYTFRKLSECGQFGPVPIGLRLFMVKAPRARMRCIAPALAQLPHALELGVQLTVGFPDTDPQLWVVKT